MKTKKAASNEAAFFVYTKALFQAKPLAFLVQDVRIFVVRRFDFN